MRLLFVTPRYGQIAGGAENLCRALAERCCDGWEVEVATTCVRDLFTSANELEEEVIQIGGVLVRRFKVSVPFRPSPSSGRYLDEVRRLARSLWSADLHRFLVLNGGRFDLILFAPYLFGTTFWGAQVHPDRSALIPCLHDEGEAKLAPMKALFGHVRGAIFNTVEEQALAESLYEVRRSRVVGIGMDLPRNQPDVAAFRKKYGIVGDYLFYHGRLEEAKQVDALVRHVESYNSRRGLREPALLVLAGDGPYRPSSTQYAKVVGFLPEEEKRAALAGAVAYCTASYLESLSIAALEAWCESTPVIASSASPVLRGHVAASGGGILFSRPRGFGKAVDRFRNPEERKRAGQLGRAYVAERYSWEAVRGRFREAVATLAASHA
jgi:glycosyltransferase involved in cell wall biosynthesis